VALVLGLASAPLLVSAPSALAQEPAVAVDSVGVNINTATASELAAGLSGVGASRAEAIVRYREQFGPFESIEELAEVSGIGSATVERNRDRLRLQ
jgi:competence protein ComEA